MLGNIIAMMFVSLAFTYIIMQIRYKRKIKHDQTIIELLDNKEFNKARQKVIEREIKWSRTEHTPDSKRFGQIVTKRPEGWSYEKYYAYRHQQSKQIRAYIHRPTKNLNYI